MKNKITIPNSLYPVVNFILLLKPVRNIAHVVILSETKSDFV